MNEYELQGFRIKISSKGGTSVVWVRRSGEILELEIEEPNGKKSWYVWNAGKFESRQYEPDRFKFTELESVPWVVLEPVRENVPQEIEEVGIKAVESYLEFEQAGEEGHHEPRR